MAKNIKHLILLITALFASNAHADISSTLTETDNGGYPIFYLKSENNDWECSREMRFRRDGHLYSLYVDDLSGEFSISTKDNSTKIGPENPNTMIDKSSIIVRVVPNGENFSTRLLKHVRISFLYTIADGFCKGGIIRIEHKATPDMQEPPEPWLDQDGKSEVSETLPVIFINVYKTDENGDYLLDEDNNKILEEEICAIDLSHKNYFKGEYWIELHDNDILNDPDVEPFWTPDKPMPLQIKARGNYTRTAYPKKPFKLKLDKKQNLFGLTPSKNKHYALLAHADDSRGFLRNYVGFNLGQRLGLPTTPKMQPVELVLNGKYWGLYFLTESIRVGKDRVDIAELDDLCSDPELCSGGYIVEIDNYPEPEESQIVMEQASCAEGHILSKLRITFDTPELYSELQRNFIRDSFEAMQSHIANNSDELWSYIDIDDAVRYYLACEITSDIEAYNGSTYLYRDRGNYQKWHFSPLWDFGNAFRGPTNGFFYDNDLWGNTWIPSFRENGKFNKKIKETWKWFLYSQYNGLYDDIYKYVQLIRRAAKNDYERWNDSPTPQEKVVDNRDMIARRNEVISHLCAKIKWLKEQWGFPTSDTTEPERDDTPGYGLPYYFTGVDKLPEESATEGAYRLIDIYGRTVNHPVPGQILIRVTDKSATKIIWR